MAYKILSASWPESLAEKVNKYIKDGWKPCGSMSSTGEQTDGIDYHGQSEPVRTINTFYQPMAREQ